MIKKAGFMVLFGIAIASAANASVDLDRVCMLKGKGYLAGDVVLTTQAEAGLGTKGLVCSMVGEQSMWLSLADQSVDVVQENERREAEQHAPTK
ncbi:TPA: hypothetical protein ACKRQV_001232 [Pseudomonas aeruginosa]|nr:hypothetical protein [Pseudomonas aeruginosa]EIU2864419.1 hypothetical protein [Pseudomonas aeruginosa]